MDSSASIIPFDSSEFGELRTLSIDGEPWFVAADPCAALGHSNVSVALSRLDDDEKAKFNLGLPGGATNCVNFPGLLSLILGSRKPEAREYKRWVTHEVLPSIHKRGAYLTPDKVEEVLLNPDTIIRLATDLKDERARSRALEESVRVLADENDRMLPQAHMAASFIECEGTYTITDAAKLLRQVDPTMSRRRLFQLLRRDRMVEVRTNKATATAIERGYLVNVATSYTDPSGVLHAHDIYARATPKGVSWMSGRYCSHFVQLPLCPAGEVA